MSICVIIRIARVALLLEKVNKMTVKMLLRCYIEKKNGSAQNIEYYKF